MLTRGAAKRRVDLFEASLALGLRELLQRVQDQVRDISGGLFLVNAFRFCRHDGILTLAFG